MKKYSILGVITIELFPLTSMIGNVLSFGNTGKNFIQMAFGSVLSFKV